MSLKRKKKKLDYKKYKSNPKILLLLLLLAGNTMQTYNTGFFLYFIFDGITAIILIKIAVLFHKWGQRQHNSDNSDLIKKIIINWILILFTAMSIKMIFINFSIIEEVIIRLF